MFTPLTSAKTTPSLSAVEEIKISYSPMSSKPNISGSILDIPPESTPSPSTKTTTSSYLIFYSV